VYCGSFSHREAKWERRGRRDKEILKRQDGT